MNTKLCDGIDWVGSIDWNLRDFHSFEAAHGVTYNAYLVQDEKNALIDTVKAPWCNDMLAKIAALVPLDSIEYLICNHAEPDHSGALPVALRAMPRATLVCNKKCVSVLNGYYDTRGWKIHVLEPGETIRLGRRSLQPIETPMVHWPESMVTWMPEENILFSNDAFGQHYCCSGLFDDQGDLCIALEELKAYYANIVVPYNRQVVGVMQKLDALDIKMIAPSHGIIWRRHVPEVLQTYRDWSVGRSRPKVVILFDTMWESTTAMAEAILEGAAAVPGTDAQLYHVRRTGLTRIATEILDAACVAIGSSTLHRTMMPMMGAVANYLGGLRPPVKAALAFGSRGWGPGGPEAIAAWLEQMKWPAACDPIRADYRPTPEILQACRDAGRLLGEKAAEAAAE